MASDYKIATAVRNVACDAIVDRMDLNTPPAKVEHRTGTIPATPTTASSGTLLGTNTFSNPAFDDAGSTGGNPDGQAAANAINDDVSADATGDAGYFRIYQGASGDTACEMQGTSGEAADTPDMTFDNKSIVTGGTISISAITITVPEQ